MNIKFNKSFSMIELIWIATVTIVVTHHLNLYMEDILVIRTFIIMAIIYIISKMIRKKENKSE
jgi:hypothetical protein